MCDEITSMCPAYYQHFPILILLGLSAWLSGCATPQLADDPYAAKRQHIVSTAESLVGTPYVLGGKSPSGFDCSGLVHYTYRQAGVRTPRTAAQQFQASQPQRQVLPGDLLFFRSPSSSDISHVGIYAGSGQMIHASSGSKKVRKVPLKQRYWQNNLVGGATLLGTSRRTAPASSTTRGYWPEPNG